MPDEVHDHLQKLRQFIALGRLNEAEHTFEKLSKLASLSAEQQLHRRVLRLHLLAGRGRPNDCIAESVETLELARECGDLHAQADAAIVLAAARIDLADFDGAR